MTYEPHNVGTLADLALHLKPRSIHTVTPDGNLTITCDPSEAPPKDAYSIQRGKIYIVSTDDQEAATKSSIELALSLHQKAPVCYLSFAGNNDILPLRMQELNMDPEASMLMLHCLEKFSFYEDEYDKDFSRYIKNQDPSVLIINMIDWAVQTDRHRQRLAADLGVLADSVGCAIVVYTMESVTRIRKARDNGRGWIGTLAKLSQRQLSYVQSVGETPNARPSDRPNAPKISENTPRSLTTTILPGRMPIPLHDNELPPACKFPTEPVDDRPARIRFRAPGVYLEPRTPLEKLPFEQLTRIPIEMKFRQSDWHREWAEESKWISKIVRELEFKKKHGLLRMDPDKLKEYQADYPNFYKKFKEMYCAETGEEEIISM